MNTFITFICDYWYIVIAVVAVLTVSGILVYSFIKIPPNQQIAKMQEWLLYAVIAAERELGSGTGKIKLRMVYDMFLGRFPSLANIFSFEAFSGFIDTALDEMEHLLKNNSNLAQYIGRNNETDTK